MKPMLVAACLCLSAAAQAQNPVFPVTDTTCGSTSTINELSYGIYSLPGLDRVYTMRARYPFLTQLALTSGSQNTTGLIFATCSEPPGPQARCMAIWVAPGQTESLRLTDDPLGSPERDYWFVVDAYAGCGSFVINASAPIG
jgi:hypothetical protein